MKSGDSPAVPAVHPHVAKSDYKPAPPRYSTEGRNLTPPPLDIDVGRPPAHPEDMELEGQEKAAVQEIILRGRPRQSRNGQRSGRAIAKLNEQEKSRDERRQYIGELIRRYVPEEEIRKQVLEARKADGSLRFDVTSEHVTKDLAWFKKRWAAKKSEDEVREVFEKELRDLNGMERDSIENFETARATAAPARKLMDAIRVKLQQAAPGDIAALQKLVTDMERVSIGGALNHMTNAQMARLRIKERRAALLGLDAKDRVLKELEEKAELIANELGVTPFELLAEANRIRERQRVAQGGQPTKQQQIEGRLNRDLVLPAGSVKVE